MTATWVALITRSRIILNRQYIPCSLYQTCLVCVSGPAVDIKGSGGVVRSGVCQFEKDRNSPSSNNSLLAVGVGGTLSAPWHSLSMQD